MWKLALGTTESCGKEWPCLEADVVQCLEKKNLFVLLELFVHDRKMMEENQVR